MDRFIRNLEIIKNSRRGVIKYTGVNLSRNNYHDKLQVNDTSYRLFRRTITKKTRPALIKDTDNSNIKEIYSLSRKPPIAENDDVKWEKFLNDEQYIRTEEYNIELNPNKTGDDAINETSNYSGGDTYLEECEFAINEISDSKNNYTEQDFSELMETMEKEHISLDSFSQKTQDIILSENPNASYISAIDIYNLKNNTNLTIDDL